MRGTALVFLVAALLAFTGTARAAPGDLDPSFDGDGKVTFSPLGRAGSVSDVAVQPDGKIILVGSVDDGTATSACGGRTLNDFAVTRLNQDGSIDTGFGQDGTTTLSFPVGVQARYDDSAKAVALQSDGRIVVAATTAGDTGNCQPGSRAVAVARLIQGGSLDQSFSPGGPEGAGEATLVLPTPKDATSGVARRPRGGRARGARPPRRRTAAPR